MNELLFVIGILLAPVVFFLLICFAIAIFYAGTIYFTIFKEIIRSVFCKRPNEILIYVRQVEYRFIKISDDVYIGETPVTQRLYEDIVGSNPSQHFDRYAPVHNVSRLDAEVFCQLLSKGTKYTIDLPTVEEWRQALNGEHDFNDCNLDGYSPTPVKRYSPNSLGVYDLIGNVWEWTKTFNLEPVYGIVCGGSWFSKLDAVPILISNAFTGIKRVDAYDDNVGFRVVIRL